MTWEDKFIGRENLSIIDLNQDAINDNGLPALNERVYLQII